MEVLNREVPLKDNNSTRVHVKWSLCIMVTLGNYKSIYNVNHCLSMQSLIHLTVAQTLSVKSLDTYCNISMAISLNNSLLVTYTQYHYYNTMYSTKIH